MVICMILIIPVFKQVPHLGFKGLTAMLSSGVVERFADFAKQYVISRQSFGKLVGDFHIVVNVLNIVIILKGFNKPHQFFG